ncbi:hypothetical protein [Nocardia sp. NPDC051463]|uniref:hypothetical protein n=1 Tax=Nocardia sp. NPDC051463 TaxID=3154845 RepID=UPI00344D4A48
MNYANHFRTAAIGVIAGAVTVTGFVLVDEHDPIGIIQDAIARRRLSPAERAEFDRLTATKAAVDRSRQRAKDKYTADLRAKFAPALLGGKNPVHTLEELSVPQLLAGIEQAENSVRVYGDPWAAPGPDRRNEAPRWSEHLAALLNEFDARMDYTVRFRLPRLDLLRLEAAERRIKDEAYGVLHRFQFQSSRPAPPPSDGLYPDFTGPDTVVADSIDTSKKEI